MDAYILEWLSLIVRWLHVITGVAWIGASFYFMWLDNSLEPPSADKEARGIKGELWSIHGGGIYEVAKYKLAPQAMPATLHWFKWEAYSTWLTGMVLLTLVYYLGADAYLIDSDVANLSTTQAIVIGVSFLLGGWVAYELLCRSPLGKHDRVIAALLILAGIVAAYTLTQLFSGRGAYIHFGAMIGTLMAGNVFRVIIPSQKALVAAIEQGNEPDPRWGARAKLHSTHNTYLTLPLLFIMISAHYPMTYTHQFNWLILLVLTAITAIARQYFMLRHKQINKPLILVGTIVATVLLAWVIAPPTAEPVAQRVSADPALSGRAINIVRQRCASCHSATPTDDVFTVAPGGVLLEEHADIKRWAARIKARSVDAADMPFLNKTGMTERERDQLKQWIEAGAALPH